jgi:predicted ATPase/class 3 adenylate cyclase
LLVETEERTPVQVQLLGGVGVTRDDGTPVDVGPAKCQILLAALGLSAGEAVPIPRLVELVWGDDPPRTAERTLQSYVTRLRKGLGADTIERSGNAYRLVLDRGAIDACRFQHHLEGGDPEAGLAEWTGTPLAGLEAVGLEPMVNGLTEQWLGAVEAALERRVELDAAAALGRLTELTAQYPFREGLWALRMLALYKVGRQAEALAAYREARAHLVEGLGAEPGPRLRELEGLILGQDDRLGPGRPRRGMAVAPPTGTVTFGFCDVEGSSQLWASDSEVMPGVVARHDEIVTTLVETWRGHVFATGGDSFGVAFQRVSDAIGWARDLQEGMASEPWPRGMAIRLRIGLHTGEADERGGNYFGSAVNIASRVTAAGHGGQTLLSSLTAALAGKVTTLDLGTYRLPDVVETQRILQLGRDPFPALRIDSTQAGNLPGLRGRLIGREDVVENLRKTMASGRLITVIGPGGIGKTRVAIETARRDSPNRPDGTWLVELASIVDSRDVERLVADAIGVSESGARTLSETIVDFLEGRTCVLVLDNCEHVISNVSAFVQLILGSCPGVTILATSREGLGILDEVLVALPPLDVTEAAALFAERALAIDLSFDPEADRDVVEEVCRRLDGVPLAIELAAARVRTLTPTDLAQRLDDRLRLLTAGRRSPVERHRSLRATIDWSYDLLEPEQQLLFTRLSVFAGPFDLAAVEAVTIDDQLDAVGVDDILGHLVDRSMVLPESGPFGRRFRLLETMRQYAADQLAAAGETGKVGRRHAQWCAAHVNQIGSMLHTSAEIEAVARLDEVWDNLRVAVGWACDAEDLDLALKLIEPVLMELTSRSRLEIGTWAERMLDVEGASTHERHDSMVHMAALRYRWTSDRAGFERLIEEHGGADHPRIRWERANLDYDWETVVSLGPAAAADVRSHGLELAAEGIEFNSVLGLAFLGRIDELETSTLALLKRWGNDAAPTQISFGLYGLALAARAKGDHEEASRLLDQMRAIDRPPNTWNADEMLDALDLFERGDRQAALAKLGTIIDDYLQTETHYMALTVCRYSSTILSRLDRATNLARIMGFYRASLGGDQHSPLTAEADSYLETRMTPDLEHEITLGAELTNQQVLEHLLSVFAELQTDH